eukprot:gene4009-14089_t
MVFVTRRRQQQLMLRSTVAPTKVLPSGWDVGKGGPTEVLPKAAVTVTKQTDCGLKVWLTEYLTLNSEETDTEVLPNVSVTVSIATYASLKVLSRMYLTKLIGLETDTEGGAQCVCDSMQALMCAQGVVDEYLTNIIVWKTDTEVLSNVSVTVGKATDAALKEQSNVTAARKVFDGLLDKSIVLENGYRGWAQCVLDRRQKQRMRRSEVLPNVSVTVGKATDAALKVHSYEVHPRLRHLVASSILSRLQLAALYSATSSLLPEPRSRMTGAQLAMRLVRQSSTNRPLSTHERNHLEGVARFGGHLAPGLHLLCLELESSSFTQTHLHGNDGGQEGDAHGGSPSSGSHPSTLEDPKFASLYLQQSYVGDHGGWCHNPRMLLQAAEEESAMGMITSRQALDRHWIRTGEHRQLEVEAIDIHHDVVTKVEEQLLAMDSVTQRRKEIEQYLLQSLNEVPELQSARDGDGSIRRSFRMLRIADGAAAAGLSDLVEAALHAPDHLLTFNPFLTKQSCQVLHQAILIWLQLCVLEDRLKRLELFCKAGATQQLVQELLVRRQWSVSEYPEWLVFEVEGGLQIRPQQYAVATRLIREPGAIAQLNMGEGKTRVILPMLVLHLAKGKHLVRLNFLSTLLSEARAHLHNHICASVLGRKVFIQPFNRDVELTVSNVKAMTASLKHCQKSV